MSKQRRLDHDRVIQLSAHGYSPDNICEEVGAQNKDYIQHIIRKYQREHPGWSPGCESDHAGLPPLDTGKVKALHKAGWGIEKIHKEFCGDYPIEEIRRALDL